MIANFTSILVAILYEEWKADMFAGIEIPAGMVPVDQRHVTLLSSEIGKDARKALKEANLVALQEAMPFPTVTFSSPAYVADNGKKRSLVVDCDQQAEIRQWVVAAMAKLGIEYTLNPDRVYHLSVANLTGSQFDSVPDPWNCRV